MQLCHVVIGKFNLGRKFYGERTVLIILIKITFNYKGHNKILLWRLSISSVLNILHIDSKKKKKEYFTYKLVGTQKHTLCRHGKLNQIKKNGLNKLK